MGEKERNVIYVPRERISIYIHVSYDKVTSRHDSRYTPYIHPSRQPTSTFLLLWNMLAIFISASNLSWMYRVASCCWLSLREWLSEYSLNTHQAPITSQRLELTATTVDSSLFLALFANTYILLNTSIVDIHTFIHTPSWLSANLLMPLYVLNNPPTTKAPLHKSNIPLPLLSSMYKKKNNGYCFPLQQVQVRIEPTPPPMPLEPPVGHE